MRFLLVLTAILGGVYAYLALRLAPQAWAKAALAVPLIFIWLVPVIYWIGGRSRTRADELLHVASYLCMGWLSFALVFSLLRDALMLIGVVIDPIYVLIASVLALGGGALAAFRGPRLKRVDIRIEGLHPALEGFRIAQITDLHIGTTIRRAYVSRVVRMANELEADLVAVTGDLVDGPVARLAPHAAPLADLKPAGRVYFVMGNHEYYSGARQWLEHFRTLGFRTLLNENESIRVGDATLLVGGVLDPAGGQPQPDLAMGTGDFKLLLAHNPKIAPLAERAGFDLQLSGHTHAGQFFPWTLAVRLVHSPHVAGLSREGRMQVYVSAGTGSWGPPVRFGTSPELTLIRLVGAPRMTRSPALAPFSVRSFRFQWPADLLASWAFEMETLILGWYVLAETGSVELLVLFGALVWLGSIGSPFLGLVGDRVGFRALLCATRAVYAVLAMVLAALSLSGALVPWHVFAVTALAGLLRPSDMMLRNVLVGQTMQPHMLMGALGISRTTSDSAKIAGALAGTGAVALVGMGAAYLALTLLYVISFALSLGVAGASKSAREASAGQVLAHLKDALRYVWSSPEQLGAFSIAFFANLLAYPFYLGLLPYAAKEVNAIGQAGLGYLAAAFACGAFAGSIVVGAGPMARRAGRVMLVASGAWFAAVLLMGQIPHLGIGLALIFAAGMLQSLCLVPLAAVMLRSASEEMRGRVMGMRSLAVWGLPLGLLIAGPTIAHIGFAATTAIYGGLGLLATIAVGIRLRRALWERAAPANSGF